jgi:hypothetical protein
MPLLLVSQYKERLCSSLNKKKAFTYSGPISFGIFDAVVTTSMRDSLYVLIR